MSSLLQCPSKLLFPLHHPYSNSTPRLLHLRRQTVPIFCAKRTGKQRYPSEKKKLKLKQKEALSSVTDKFQGIWRLSKLAVSVKNDPGKDFLHIHIGLLQEIAKVLEFPVFSILFNLFFHRNIFSLFSEFGLFQVASLLPEEAFSVVRKSFDARKVINLFFTF